MGINYYAAPHLSHLHLNVLVVETGLKVNTERIFNEEFHDPSLHNRSGKSRILRHRFWIDRKQNSALGRASNETIYFILGIFIFPSIVAVGFCPTGELD